MKIIDHRLSTAYNYLNTIKARFTGQYSESFGEQIVDINTDTVNGFIKIIRTRENKWYTEIDLKTTADISIPLFYNENDTIQFMYCSKGSVSQGFQGDGYRHLIKEFQTAIIFDLSQKSEITIKKGEEAKLVVISVAKPKRPESTSLSQEIYDLFAKKLVNDRFLYYGSYNLKIAEEISKINHIAQKGLVRSLYAEGMVQLILALEIQNQQHDLKLKQEELGSLNIREQKIIKEIAEEIKSNYDRQYSIKYLITQTGLSAAKLQEGFKLLYNRTVTDYIKNVRIENAERLLKTSDLNISEIVYSIGFTSRSYFSKIFKERYRCSPKDYQEKSRIHSLAVTA